MNTEHARTEKLLSVKWKWLEGKLDEYLDFFVVNDSFISMQILASASVLTSASADMSGPYVYTVYYLSLLYMYNAHVCQFKIVWPVF